MVTKALVILSGGQDSTTCLFWARKKFDEIHAITFDYGQRHKIEIESAKKVARMAKVETHTILSLPDILVSSSPLLSDNELEKYESMQQMTEVIGNRVELTFVPLRNTFFFTVAANRALALECYDLVTGICQEDGSNYPDCTENFRQSFETMVNFSLGTTGRFHIHAPLMNLSKADTVRLAHELPGCWDALAFTHTSYDGKYPPIDMNHSNVLRAHGFKEAGLPDPLILRANREGLMDLPSSSNYDEERAE